MRIIPAQPAHAAFLAHCIMDAVGEDICDDFRGEDHTSDDVKNLFTSLALREDTQYSYRNALVTIDENDNPVGAIIGYDGAGLHPMREHFFTAAREMLGRDMRGMEDECEAGEFYIDTLAVIPEHRGKGLAKVLLKAMIERAVKSGRPAGLLVDKENHKARRLYESIGFRKVGERPFAFVMMDHLQIG